MIMDIYDGRESMKDRPMKGFIQVLQVLLFFVGGIVIIAIVVNKSPTTLFAGLGASAAILMLVFKDSILGFVAGIQLFCLGIWGSTLPKHISKQKSVRSIWFRRKCSGEKERLLDK